MKVRGFSLVEIVVALIIFSVITAALAPIITKKLKSTGVTIGGKELKMTCSDKFGPQCGLCYPDKCVSCSKSCLANQALNIGECNCEDCNVIHQATCLRCDTGNCTECTTPNYISNGDCTICPIGSYCNGTNKIVCPNGKYTNTTGQTSCKDCEAGYYCKGGEKKECSAGKYSSANSADCATCPVGYYCPGVSDKIQCSGNKYQPNEGKTSCLTCSAGSYVSSDRAQCLICEAGYKCTGDGSKVACGAGTYQPYTGQTTCIACSAGYTCSGATQTYCAAGSYSSTAGATSCTTCPKGYYCTGGTNKTACGSGKYNDLTGQGSSTACKTCSSKTANCATCNSTTGVCTGCVSGYELENGSCSVKSGPPRNEYDCTRYGAIFYNNICISGEISGNAPGVEYLTLYSTCNSGSCLWFGSRITATWNAANAICTNYDPGSDGVKYWRLPTSNETTGFKPILNTLGVYDDYFSSEGTPYGGCYGAIQGTCHRNILWTQDIFDANGHYAYYLDIGRWVKAAYTNTFSFQFRCVASIVPYD